MGFVVDTFAVIPQPDEEGRYPLAPNEAFVRELAYPSALRKPVRDHGTRAFDGSAYDAVIAQITGMSLIRDYIAPEVVAQMSARLDAIAENDTLWADLTREERRTLVQWFRVCQQHGYGVYGALRLGRKAGRP